ncbi:MAG: hypothetical protein SGJ18_05665 [Pseudomonadota bacterium]|nr:hypothetical protein [Pseudomonadota bacterium]
MFKGIKSIIYLSIVAYSLTSNAMGIPPKDSVVSRPVVNTPIVKPPVVVINTATLGGGRYNNYNKQVAYKGYVIVTGDKLGDSCISTSMFIKGGTYDGKLWVRAGLFGLGDYAQVLTYWNPSNEEYSYTTLKERNIIDLPGRVGNAAMVEVRMDNARVAWDYVYVGPYGRQVQFAKTLSAGIHTIKLCLTGDSETNIRAKNIFIGPTIVLTPR